MSTNTPPARWQLWDPSYGIRFASTAAREPLYPELDLTRLLHSAGPETRTRRPDRELDAGPEKAVQSSASPSRKPGSAGITAGLDVRTASSGTAASSPAKEVKRPEANPEAIEADVEDEPPCDAPLSTFDYKVPDEAFRAARLAAPGTPESFWSYTLYRGPGEDGSGDAKVKVHYCRSRHTTERVCQYFLKEKVIGFDLEWMSDAAKWHGPRRNVCLVQLAS